MSRDYVALRQKDLQLWTEWKTSGQKPAKLKPLQDSMQGIVISTVNKYKGVDIARPILKAEANKHLVESFKSYNPNKGAQLHTHAINMMRRVDRFVKDNQNFGRVVEQRAQKWQDYLTAKNLLTQRLGRPPTAIELAQKMSLQMGRGITPKEAERFMREDRKDLVQTGLDQNAFEFMPTPDRLILKMLPAELTSEENAVFTRLYGINGSRKMRPGEIARDLRISNAKVTRLKDKIAGKIEAYF
jgi:DNA-directed RNA polymerase specialized sigma subunit